MIFESFIAFFSKVLFFTGLVNEKSGFPKALTKEEEAKLIDKYMKGDMGARDALIRHNMRLVAHVVKKYNGSAEADDLISCGTIGLIKAINTFKPEKGTQISTYAARCIDNEMLMFLRVTKKHQGVHSLNESLGNDKDGNDIVLSDILPVEGSDEANDRTAIKQIFKKFVKKIKEELPEREYEVISLRYGLENNISLPQREVAEKLNISRSYISRIEKHALELIRSIADEPEFRGFNY
ncbi:MAG: RNA polymerase sporulation sigma factor SigK [Christensenellaceae bacterium]|nr:RNA polymerase sporulation sigma factor SigK [Christensenellaceae bacterium]